MSYTKGPWGCSPQSGKNGQCFDAQVWDSDGLNLATIESTKDPKEASSNAKLIAAAPELLAMIECIAKANECEVSGGFLTYEESDEIHALIAKAKS